MTSEVLPAIRGTGRYIQEQEVETVIEPTRPLTTDDYIKASQITSLAKKETLPYALYFLTKAGIEVPKIQDFKQTVREFLVSTSVTEYLKEYDVENRISGEVYRDYTEFCYRNSMEPVSHITFSRQVNKLLNTKTVPTKINGRTTRVFVL